VSDGAHLGVSADRALGTILGGEPSPGEEEQMGVVEFREWLELPDQEPHDYGEAARRMARVILAYFLEDPRRATYPTESEYDFAADPDHGCQGMKPEFTNHVGLYEMMKRDGRRTDDFDGCSGFQWGWAVNAARRCVELPPVPNPAIIEIGDAVR